jgi:hypothetical protein
MMTKRLSGLTALLFSISVQAQLPTARATIVSNDGQSTRSEIRLTTDERTPQNFTIVNPGGKEVLLDRSMIKSLAFIDGDIYERFFIDIAVMVKNLQDRDRIDYKEPKYRQKGEYLVERLMKGPVSLYQFIDEYHFIHFFYKLRTDSVLTYLPNESYGQDGELHQDQSYRNLIQFLWTSNRCEGNADKLYSNLGYISRDMLKTFQKLNSCMGMEVDIAGYQNRKKPILSFGAFAGGTFYKYKKSGNLKYTGSLNPTLGIFMDILPGKEVKNYAVHIDLSYQSGETSSNTVTENLYSIQQRYKLHVLALDPYIHFYLQKQPQGVYLLAGIHFGYLLKPSTSFTSHQDPLGYSYVSVNDMASQMQLMALGGIGYRVGPAFIQGYYAIPAFGDMPSYLSITAKFAFLSGKPKD